MALPDLLMSTFFYIDDDGAAAVNMLLLGQHSPLDGKAAQGRIRCSSRLLHCPIFFLM